MKLKWPCGFWSEEGCGLQLSFRHALYEVFIIHLLNIDAIPGLISCVVATIPIFQS
ncbi:hypothetical protein HGB07_06455 [Candidatus Roizmanbacteria bacterium]|nr:hypothetical protein [Candidatus Roizmanbacteria bacterium]